MKIHTVIICDQVRREDNGKLLFLGVYLTDIVVSDFPTRIAPTLWMQLYMDRNGKFDIEFRIQKDKKNLSHGKGIMNVEDYLHPVAISLPPAPIDIDGECTLSFQVREKNKRWKTVKEILVKKGPNAD